MSDVRPRAARLAIDGVLLLDKPAGLSSQTAVTRVKALFNAAKAGHTGTLDPMATGLLPIALGEATKFSGALLEAGKRYVATLRLGQTTTTGDLEGEITATRPVQTSPAAIEAVLKKFRGEIVQTPPMYSALKHAGKPLYQYAREGTEIERTPRRVTIEALTLEGFSGCEARIAVSCTKGTYIRVLAEDIGNALDCGACLAALRRTRVGQLDIGDALSLDALGEMPSAERAGHLLPVDTMVAELPLLELDEDRASRVTMGMAVSCDCAADGLVRMYAPGHVFLGLGMAVPPGRVQPRRLVAQRPQS